MSTDLVAYYLGKQTFYVKSSIVPPKNSLINIRGKTYKVILVTYALDYSEQPLDNRVHRANVELKGPLT